MLQLLLLVRFNILASLTKTAVSSTICWYIATSQRNTCLFPTLPISRKIGTGVYLTTHKVLSWKMLPTALLSWLFRDLTLSRYCRNLPISIFTIYLIIHLLLAHWPIFL